MSTLESNQGDEFLAWLEGLTEDICLPSQVDASSSQGSKTKPSTSQPAPVVHSNRTRRTYSKRTNVLEAQISRKEAQLKELLIDNVYLVERNKMVQRLIQRRKDHASRFQQMRDGSLDYNPFAMWKTTVAEFQSTCTPSWFGARLADIVETCAVLLAAASPLLNKHPELASKNAWQEAQLCLPFKVQEGSPEGQQLEALKQLVVYVQKFRRAYDHGFIYCPKATMVGGAHFELFQLENIDTWEAFVQARASRLNEAATSPATDAHWSKAIEQCKLSDEQRLAAFVLWDLITTAKRSITARRTALFQALTQLRQSNTQSSLMISTSDKPAVWVDSDVLDQEQSFLHQIEAVNEREKMLFNLVGDMMHCEILSPVQLAMVKVAGFPYVADVIAQARAAAVECTKEVMARLADQCLAGGNGKEKR